MEKPSDPTNPSSLPSEVANGSKQEDSELSPLLSTVPVTRLPHSVTGLRGCIAHELAVIEAALEDCYDRDDQSIDGYYVQSLEDAVDDGFMCVDLRVLERKLEAWHDLYSPSLLGGKNTAGGQEEISDLSNNYDYTVTPFFAVKCNPDPVVVEWLAKTAQAKHLPLGFDCASLAELELAKTNIEKYGLANQSIGSHNNLIPTVRIVYANPQRAEADLTKALELFSTAKPSHNHNHELWLTLDGVEEVSKIAAARDRFLEANEHLHMPTIKMVLRIWVPDGHSQVPLGEKFGMRLGEIDRVLRACWDHKIPPKNVLGISFHCGSGCESVATYQQAIEMGKAALDAVRENVEQKLLDDGTQATKDPHRCWLLDIGGGFPGVDGLYGDEGRFAAAGAAKPLRAIPEAVPSSQTAAVEEKKEADPAAEEEPAKTTTVADIARAVRPLLQSLGGSRSTLPETDDVHPPLTLIAEPGRYFVEGAFALASRIYQKQRLPVSGDEEEDLRVYRIPHGVQGVFKDVILCGETFVPLPLKNPSAREPSSGVPSTEEVLFRSRVLGPSGEDSDVVCAECWLPELSVGDWLVFDRMGAYTLSIASRAGRPVLRYVRGGGGDEEEPPPEGL